MDGGLSAGDKADNGWRRGTLSALATRELSCKDSNKSCAEAATKRSSDHVVAVSAADEKAYVEFAVAFGFDGQGNQRRRQATRQRCDL